MLYPESNNGMQMEIARDALQRAIGTDLTERQREVILLHYYEECGVTEIASRLELDKSTVSRTLKRARERLRKSMQFYMDYMNRCSGESFGNEGR